MEEMCCKEVRKVLRTLSEDKVVTVARHLVEEMGLEELSDLGMITECDLLKVLKPLQERKLVQAWSIYKGDLSQSFVEGI